MTTYIDTIYRFPNIGTGQMDTCSLVDWTAITRARLAWAHGPERAVEIMAGRDPATQADLRAWRELGRRSAA